MTTSSGESVSSLTAWKRTTPASSVMRHGREAEVLEDDAVAADAGEDRGGSDAGLVEAFAQQPAQRLGLGRVGGFLLLPVDGPLELHLAAAGEAGDDVQLVLVPVDGEETWHEIALVNVSFDLYQPRARASGFSQSARSRSRLVSHCPA